MVDICLLGTGGVMPLPERSLTSLYVCREGRAILVDCGEGTQIAMRRFSRKFSRIEAILFTHFHADHISGLPGLLLTLGLEGREAPLAMYGPVGLEAVVTSLLQIAPDLPFEIVFHEIDTAGAGASFSCADLFVEAFPAEHSVPCLGYCFTLARKPKFDPKRAKEKGVPIAFWKRLQDGESVGGFSPSDVLGEARRGIRFLYATDTRPVPAIEHLGQDADLLILEGMYGEGEKQERAESAGHMMMQEAVQVAARAGARRLWLTHFSPAMPAPQDYLGEICEVFENTAVCADGTETVLEFEE